MRSGNYSGRFSSLEEVIEKCREHFGDINIIEFIKTKDSITLHIQENPTPKEQLALFPIFTKAMA